MSYDLEVYTVCEPSPIEVMSAGTWQIASYGPHRVDPEDLPNQVAASLPGIGFLTQLHLEGVAPDSALEKLQRVANTLAKEFRGVVLDQQTGELSTPRGVKRYTPDPILEPDDLLSLSLFTIRARFDRGLTDGLLRVIRGRVPELLPRRYGAFEPPQFRASEQPPGHLNDFLFEHRHQVMIWECSQPFSFFHLMAPNPVGPSRQGFRVGGLTVEFQRSILATPGWGQEFRSLIFDLRCLLNPFYIEVRPSIETTFKTWWWNGIPKDPPLYCSLDQPYSELWGAFQEFDQIFNEDGKDVRTDVWNSIPPDLVQPPEFREEYDPKTGEFLSRTWLQGIQYPVVWPFEGPYKKN